MRYFHSMPETEEKYWYQRRKLKQVSGFLTKKQKEELQRIARNKSDLTLVRYITRLLIDHIKQNSQN